MAYDYIPYLVAEAYCLIFSGVIFSQLSSSLGSEHEVRELKNLIFTFFVMLVADMLWISSFAHFIDLEAPVPLLLNAITDIAITAGCYFWYRFAEARLNPTIALHHVYRRLINVPLLLACVLDLASVFTGWLFAIDATGRYVETNLFAVQNVINMFYALMPTLNALYLVTKTHSHLRRREYGLYCVYLLAPITASTLEYVIPQVPIIALNVFVVILVLFLTLQNQQIYNDALTGLNNRRRLDQYLENKMENANDENPVVLYMLDVNAFKHINDTYGHIAGDEALRMFASALRLVANRYDAFIACYGGDEFCLVMEASLEHLEQTEADILKALDTTLAITTSQEQKYRISASIGYAVCKAASMDTAALIAEADAELYRNKKLWHRDNR